MNRLGWALALALSIATASCGPKEEATPDAALDPPAPAPGAGGVQPISPATGPVSPVTGTESMQGSGAGGIHSAAKDKAREAAAGQSRPTTPDTGDE